jgi:hypothetical protein
MQGWVKEGKLDLVEKTLLALKKHLQPSADFESVRADKHRWLNLARLLGDLPGDLRADAEQFFKERSYLIPKLRKRKGGKRGP